MNQDMNRPLMPKNSTEQVIDKDGNQDLKDYILQRRKVLGKGSYATVIYLFFIILFIILLIILFIFMVGVLRLQERL